MAKLLLPVYLTRLDAVNISSSHSTGEISVVRSPVVTQYQHVRVGLLLIQISLTSYKQKDHFELIQIAVELIRR